MELCDQLYALKLQSYLMKDEQITKNIRHLWPLIEYFAKCQNPHQFEDEYLKVINKVVEDYAKNDFDSCHIVRNLELSRALMLSGVAQGKYKSGIELMKQKCHQHIMDNPAEIDDNPEIAYEYMQFFRKLWRGKNGLPSYTVDQMLDFCDKYFDTLALDNCKGRDLRTILKKTLKTLENDIKVDSQV